MTPVELLLSKFPNAKRQGKQWAVRCPAHKDNRPSLSITEGEGGRALVHCHAGCTPEAITTALGLKLSDLMPKATRKSEATARPPRTPRTFVRAADAVAALERQHGPRDASWIYHNANGEPVGVVIRWNTPTGKEIRPVSKTSAGWIIGGMSEPRPLYRLPDLLKRGADVVYVCEGEKAADAAAELGLLATTSPHGSKCAGKADWSPLAGRDVVILPDQDEAGANYAGDVAGILAKQTSAAKVRVVNLADAWPDLPVGADMAHVVVAGEDASTIKAKLAALVDAAEPESQPSPAVEPFKPFPTDALPEPVRSFVTGAAKAIGCDASYVALPILSALASAIGNTHRIALKRGWTEPAIVWTAIVGESGTMKTPAFKLAMKAIRKAQDRAWKEYEAARAEWEAQEQRYEAELAAWKRDAAKAKPGSKNMASPPEKPIAPIARRYIVSDTTTEALAPILLNNPRGVLLARDELAGWWGSFDRYAKAGKAGADSAHWLSMHNGEAMTIDRKTGTPPTIHIPSASVSITGGIQPGILARALGREHHESGMAARVLFAMPPRRAKRWTEADVDADTEAAVVAVFDRLLSLSMEKDPESADPLNPDLRPILLRLTDDGKAAWVRFYNEHANEQAELSGDLSAAWSKLEGYAARLALLVHLTRWAAGDATLCDPTRVDEASISAGVVLARWFGDEARRVYGVLGEDDEERNRRRLVDLIERKGGSISGRELVQSSRAYRTVDDANAALEDLAEQGFGSWQTPAQTGPGGPKARRFVLAAVYGVNVYGNPDGDDANGNSVDVDNVDSRKADCGDWGQV